MEFKQHALVEGLRSTHIWTVELFFLGTTTIPGHHSVGLPPFEMTLSASICASLSSMSLQSGRGTHLGAVKAYVMASGFMEISYSLPKFPKPHKRFGKALWIAVS